METYTRTREQGTQETVCNDNYVHRIYCINRIKENHQYEKIDGVMIDATTANVIVTVYNALSLENRIKFASMPASKMASLAYKLIK